MVTENLYTKDCIRTFTGIYMNVFEPTLEMICIEDIAHALSMQCRFGGHLPHFYSVAQHCVHAVDEASEYNSLQTLMHDASEAYLMDIPRPIKNRLFNYKEIEDGLMAKISEKFDFEYPLSKHTKEIDEAMLQWEWNAIMLNPNCNYPINKCWDSKFAEKMFLGYFNQYKKT